MAGPDILTKLRGYHIVWSDDADGPLPERGILQLEGAVVVVDDRANGRTVATFGQSSSNDIAAKDADIAGDLTVGGDIVAGPLLWRWRRASTTGPGSAPILVVPIADNSLNTIDVRIVAISPTTGSTGGYNELLSGLVSIVAGTPTVAVTGTPGHSFGLPPVVTVGWAAGAFTFTGKGPSATVTGSAAGTAGVVRLTIGAGGLTSELAGRKVDVSGVGGTTEANGTNQTATFVDATHLELPGTWANAWTSGGVVVLHAPPVMSWTAAVLPRLTTA